MLLKFLRRLDGSDATIRECTRTAQRLMIEGASAKERSRGELDGFPCEHGLKWTNHSSWLSSQDIIEVGYDAAGPRQRSLAAHPCRALTECGMHSVPVRRALKLFKLVPKLPAWCRSRDSPLMSNNSAVALRTS